MGSAIEVNLEVQIPLIDFGVNFRLVLIACHVSEGGRFSLSKAQEVSLLVSDA